MIARERKGELSRTELRRRVRANVVVEPRSGCWLWSGTVTAGYGVLEVSGRRVLARRLSWAAYRGERDGPANGRRVEVTCRNRLCVNPRHLAAGRPKGGAGRPKGGAGSNGPVKYPWDRWFACGRFALVRGEHFHGQPHGMAQQARNAAYERGMRLRIHIRGDRLEVEVWKGED